MKVYIFVILHFLDGLSKFGRLHFKQNDEFILSLVVKLSHYLHIKLVTQLGLNLKTNQY